MTSVRVFIYLKVNIIEISVDSELSRIAVESRRAEELFENKLMEARDAIARVFEEHRRRRREKVSDCIIYIFNLCL